VANRPDRLPRRRLRQASALVVGAAAAAVGALILGEYDFTGATPYFSGLLFGLVVAEVVLAVGRSGTRALAVGCAAESAGGMMWAAWISSGRGVAPIPTSAFLGAGLAAVLSGTWVAFATGRHPPRHPAGRSADGELADRHLVGGAAGEPGDPHQHGPTLGSAAVDGGHVGLDGDPGRHRLAPPAE
jgi:hypothetical protein